MSYRTTCPQCASVFRLGANQLDAAQGWVQCSVCGAAFDARLSLLMEDGTPLPPQEPAPAAATAQQDTTVAADHEDHEANLAAEAEASSETAPEPASGTEDAAAADTPRGIAQRENPFDLPSIIIIDPDISVQEDLGPVPEIYPAPASYPPQPAPSPASPAPPAAAVQPGARVAPGALPAGRPRVPPARRRIAPWAWGMASVLLLVALLAQTAYFLRDTLASRLPQSRPALEQACAALGCTLSLPKDLALLQIVGSDLQTEASGRLKLTLTLGNRAAHAQAWPMLVLTLTDQRNRPLARRSFAPSEYLDDARRIEAGMPPRSEQALALPLTVRELAPMGFDLRLSY